METNRFDMYDVSAGHEGRFLEKVDALENRRRGRRRIVLSASIAAVIALFFVLRPSSPDYFRGVGDSPEAVYLSYLEQVGASYEAISVIPGSDRSDWEDAMRGVTEETIPLIDQLPDELPDAQKAALLKAYYGELLQGVERIRESVENQ